MTGSGASPASRAAGSSAVRSGELFAALSLATDLSTAQAMEHGLRTCLLAVELAERVFERWDGKGMPAGAAGERIPVAARILHAARDASAFAAAGGAEMVCAMAERAAGSSLDPRFAGLLREHAPALLERVGAVAAWERVVAAEPRPRLFTGEDLDRACQVIADYADLKSSSTRRSPT